MSDATAPSVHDEVHVEATPSEVWKLVSDIGLPARLSPELQRTAWLDGATGPELGARFEGFNRHPVAGEWRTVSQVSDLEPERRFGWAVLYGESGDASQPVATWTFELRPEGAGTHLRFTARIWPERSQLGAMMEGAPERAQKILAGRLGELGTGIGATLQGVKKLAEEAAA
ncbi:SRPBCC family protein [Streptomyces sp. AV19]|uniref:SRPBCC family protein n=1 Tax=Streptomyces sp. AV19 TaxID=2793068 RepID=UPI0018FE88D5|nr:SRPBCC family protein [Streptomyces sp. AV19]MBH1936670.1 SRPBCC family protein [Streptomyces sp. AV19]MDG4532718.1 SRPBCC family protein [Streptomyces sp. AV19]